MVTKNAVFMRSVAFRKRLFIENNRGEPVIGLELDKGEPMDEDMIRAAEADEAAAGYESLA